MYISRESKCDKSVLGESSLLNGAHSVLIVTALVEIGIFERLILFLSERI